MTRRILIEMDGVVGTARLLESEAPRACDRIWSALPLEGTARHARWSGNAVVFVPGGLDDPSYADPAHPHPGLPENAQSFLQVGTISYVSSIGEILICYGQAQSRGTDGNEWAARIADLEGDTAPLFAAFAALQHSGSSRIRISREG